MVFPPQSPIAADEKSSTPIPTCDLLEEPQIAETQSRG